MSAVCWWKRETFPISVKYRSARTAIFAPKTPGSLSVGGEEPAAYGPSMRQMVRYMKHYPLREFVTHRYALRDVNTAMQKAIEPESMKVVFEPWK